MNILFIHQNFPGQFKFLSQALAANGHNVVALSLRFNEPKVWHNVRIQNYKLTRGSSSDIYPGLRDFESQSIRAEACFKAALQLKKDGFRPDVIIAHPGWGESLFLKEVWPSASLGIYCEFFYNAKGADFNFDPEFSSSDPLDEIRLHLKNVNNILHMNFADSGVSPTKWQSATFPEPFRSSIRIIHDGVDTDAVSPNRGLSVRLNDSHQFSSGDEIITFVSRNLEPYRGYHIFMRALPEILRRRPKAQILIIGGDSVSYGSSPQTFGHSSETSWKQIFIDEVRPFIEDEDWGRVHFVGAVPYRFFLPLLQISTVHVYLTYPFVLSWSLLEAMSVGCAIVASDTPPVQEVISHDNTGRLVGFFDIPLLVDQICDLLEDPSGRARLGRIAREFVRSSYDLKRVCLPQQLDWVLSLRR